MILMVSQHCMLQLGLDKVLKRATKYHVHECTKKPFSTKIAMITFNTQNSFSIEYITLNRSDSSNSRQRRTRGFTKGALQMGLVVIWVRSGFLKNIYVSHKLLHFCKKKIRLSLYDNEIPTPNLLSDIVNIFLKTRSPESSLNAVRMTSSRVR